MGARSIRQPALPCKRKAQKQGKKLYKIFIVNLRNWANVMGSAGINPLINHKNNDRRQD